jgi:hypothetical protein
MRNHNWLKALQSLLAGSGRNRQHRLHRRSRAPQFRPTLEALQDRIAPAVLSGTFAHQAFANQDLTAEGTSDWAVWGYANGGQSTSLAPDVHKAGGSGISALTDISNGNPLRGLGQFGFFAHSFQWSDGTPTASASNATGGIQHDGQGHIASNAGEGFSFTVPADTATSTLRIYADTHGGTSQLTATLSDGSAVPVVFNAFAAGTDDAECFTIQYAAGSASQTLTVTFTLTADMTGAGSNSGNVSIEAVTLATPDTTPPTSSVNPLPATVSSSSFPVTWQGQDNPGGSGVASYNVYVSDNGGLYTQWQNQTTATSAVFTNAQPGHNYAFYSVATDVAGNVQPTPTAAQAKISVVAQATIFDPPGAAVFFAGKPNSVIIATTSFPTAALSYNGLLPGGVTFVDQGDGTAILSGNPPATTGAYTFNVIAKNGFSPALIQVFTLTVVDPPMFTSGAGATFRVGQVGSFPIATVPGLPATTTVSKSGDLPRGLTFTPGPNGTATLHGTPARGTGGTYTLTLTASNGPSSGTTQTFVLTVKGPPTITSPAAATFNVGQAESITITTTGLPAATLTESGALPAGVYFFDSGYGIASLAGIAQPGTARSTPYTITITADNGLTSAAAQKFRLTVAQPPAITSPRAATFTVGQAGSFPITTTPGLPTTTTLTESGPLPHGLTFTVGANGTATLHGNPAPGSGGTYTVIITASCSPGCQVSQALTLTVNGPPTISSPAGASFTVGQAMSFTITTTGLPTATLTESGALPAGVTFSGSSKGIATLAGIPQAGAARSAPYVLTITADNGTAPTAVQTFRLTVNQLPLITSATSDTFTVGQAARFQVTTAPGLPTTTTLTKSGALPRGVSFTDIGNGTATLRGTPAAGTGGVYPVTITAHNGPSSLATQTFTLTVSGPPTIRSVSRETFTVGQGGGFTITTTGFPLPNLTQTGALPGGVRFLDNGDGTATLTGIPQAGSGGTYAFTITAGNGGTSVTQQFTLTVDQPPLITSAAPATFTVGQSNTFTITTTGYPAGTITKVGRLPKGVTLVDQKNGTAILSGKPTVKGTFTITIMVSTGVLPEAMQTFDLTVA